MTNKVYIGAISPEGEHLLNAYLTKFLPDAEVEPLKPAGIKGKMRNRGARADVALIILDEALWGQCVGAVDDVLAMSKTHKYIDDDGLKQFLIARFGVVDIFADSGTIVPEDYIDAPDLPEMNTAHSYVPMDNVVHTVADDDIDMSTDYQEEQNIEERDSEIISELRDKLAKSEMLVRNLTQQLQDEKDDGEVKEFINRIRELETQLEAKDKELQNQSSEDYINIGKVAKAERVLAKVDSLEKQIKELGEAKAALEYDKTTLAGEIELYEGQIDELRLKVAEIEPLKSQVAERDESIEVLKKQVEESDNNIETLKKQVEESSNKLSEKEAEIGVLQSRVDEIGGVSDELTQARENIAQRDIDYNNLKIDFEARGSEIGVLNASIEDLKLQIEQLNAQIAGKTSEIEALNEEISNLSSEKTEQSGVVDSLKTQIDDLCKQIDEYKNTVAVLQEDSEKLSHKDAEINMLNANILEQRTSIINLNEQLNAQHDDMQSKIDELTVSAGDIGTKYGELLDEHRELETKFTDSEARNTELESKVAELSTSLDECTEKWQSGVEQTKQDNIKIAKLEAQIETLQESLIDAGADDETINRLNNDLLEERRKSARLQSQIDVMRKSDDSEKSDALRLEINRLRSELEAEKSKAAVVQPDMGQIDALQTELRTARERIADLEMSIAEQTETISDISNSIFSKLSTFAFMPKAAVNIGLPQVPCVDDRFYFVASGSAESVSSLYDVIRRVCVVNTGVHYLFVDLDSNSFVDSAFGTRKIESPLDWLKGEKDFRSCLSETKFPNVKVISTGFSYMNDLFYLNVDWKYRLEELKGFADVVVINIGCLNNFVTRLLFNTFNTSYKTIVVTKSAPINLRATSLELSGLLVSPNPNVTVECVNFDTRTSNNMYQRLATKYNTHILRDNDVLKL